MDFPDPIQNTLSRLNNTGRDISSELVPVPKRTLSPAQYGDLAEVPREMEWLANISKSQDSVGL